MKHADALFRLYPYHSCSAGLHHSCEWDWMYVFIRARGNLQGHWKHDICLQRCHLSDLQARTCHAAGYESWQRLPLLSWGCSTQRLSSSLSRSFQLLACLECFGLGCVKRRTGVGCMQQARAHTHTHTHPKGRQPVVCVQTRAFRASLRPQSV